MSLFSKVSVSAIAALAAIAPAAAQPPADADAGAQPDQTMSVETGSHITVIGAIKDPASAEAPVVAEDESVPELPIVYEDEESPAGQG